MTTSKPKPWRDVLPIHPAAELFPLMPPDGLKALATDIEAHGLQRHVTVQYLDGECVLLDGRNRLDALALLGREINLSSILIFEGVAEDVDPYAYVISANLHRRHLTADQKRDLIAKLLKATPEKSDRQIAEQIKSNRTTVGQIRKKLEKSGDVSIVDTRIDARGREQPASKQQTVMLPTWTGEEVPFQISKNYRPGFNETTDEVGWARWTWNPITGCKHDCQRYCYAKEIAISERMKEYYPNGFEPTFHPQRLDGPANKKVPEEAKANPWHKRVFVVSMGDLFGRWVKPEWIEKVFEVCTANPQWEYLFLTKDPNRYVELQDKLPPTAWIGTSVDEQKRVRAAEDAFRKLKHVPRIKWLSVEPMLEEVEIDLSLFDWVVIGSLSATKQHPAFAPPWEWVVRLWLQAKEAGCAVYLKTNLQGVPNSQFPGMVLPRESPVLRNGANPPPDPQPDDSSDFPAFLRRQAQ
jgi:protein gp37